VLAESFMREDESASALDGAGAGAGVEVCGA
jgi:hypothetical protein